MKNIKVNLLHHTPLDVCMKAIRTCWDSFDKSDNMGEKDLKLIERVGLKNKHESVLEHLVYNFEIKGISRLCLQELARHRIASYSVKSTRYTLKELRNKCFLYDDEDEYKKALDKASKYIVLLEKDYLNGENLNSLQDLVSLLQIFKSIDEVKYNLPECYRTDLVWTINARSLRNFLKLRSYKSAHFEIRHLANLVYKAIPNEHKFLFKDCIYENN